MGDLHKASIWVAGATLLALGLSGCDQAKSKGKDEGAKPKAALTVSVTKVALVDQPHELTASGAVSGLEEVQLAAETGGLNAVELFVEDGQAVSKGQALLKLNDQVLRAQETQSVAALAAAKARQVVSDKALARAQDLAAKGFLSTANLDQKIADQGAAAAQTQQAAASLAEVRTRLAQTVIRAPFAGKISQRSVVVGQFVSVGTPLFKMVKEGRLEVFAQIPENEIASLKSGMTADVEGDAGQKATGRIRLVTASVDASTRLGIAKITLEPAATSAGFKPGMFAKAQIHAGLHKTLSVPQTAVVYRSGKASVFVLDATRHVRLTPVQTGSREGDRVVIQQGLSDGQDVVSIGAGFLVDGDLVSLAPAKSKIG